MASATITNKELFYESIANQFDSFMNPYEVSKRLDLVFNKLLPRKLEGKKFLDAGCGVGLFSKVAVARGARVTSLDVGPRLLKEVAKRCKSKRIVGSVTNLPFDNNSFDIVLATEVIEHTSQPQKAVKELCRVLKSSGILIVTTPNKLWLPALYLLRLFNLRPYHGLEKWCWWWELSSWVQENDLTIKKSLGFNPFPLVTYFDSFGSVLGPLMINMAFLAKKER